MASPVAHGAIGVAAYLLLRRELPPFKNAPWTHGLTLVGAGILSGLPDFDIFIGVLAGEGTTAYHRLFSHSLAFAALIGLMIMAVVRIVGSGGRFLSPRTAGMAAGGLVASHVLLDFLTHDSRAPFGVPALMPFSSDYFLGPLTLFPTIQHGPHRALFSSENLASMGVDLLLTVPLLLLTWLWCRRADR